MLLRVTMQNMLSFYNETTFDMFPNPNRKSFPNHVNDTGKIPLLKHALIYGANGSGKSNFVKALQFLKEFITVENFLEKEYIDLNNFFFQLVKSNRKPMKIEIEFYTKEKYYIYSVEIKRTSGIQIHETLKLSGLGIESADTLIFERKGNVVKPTSDNTLSQQLLKKNTNSSVIPLNLRYPILNDEHVKNVYEFFKNEFEVVTINSRIPILIGLMSKNKELFNFTNKVLSSLHITNSLKVGEMPLEKWLSNKLNKSVIENKLSQNPVSDSYDLSVFHENRNRFNLTLKNGVQTVQEFLFEQIGIGGIKKKMNIATQSDGTVRLLTLVPALFDSIKGQVVIIDEVENSMHPELIFSLLKYVFNSTSAGQLICTTHLTKLQNQEDLVRPDELWIVEKQDGNSEMRSLNDYKINPTMDIRKGYEQGRYGGIPQISNIE